MNSFYPIVKVKRLNPDAPMPKFARDLWQFTGAACKKYPRMFDPAAQGGQMVQLNALDAFEQRMQKLGFEVPE